MTFGKLARCAVAIVTIGALAGCAAGGQVGRGLSTLTSSPDPALSPEDQALVDESRAIVRRSVVQGAVFGALAGCGIGFLINQSVGACAAGAAGGALLGGVAGAGVGQGNADAAAAETEKEELIAELEAERERLVTFEAKLLDRIAEQNAELDRLGQQIASNQVDQATYSKRYREIQSFRRQIDESLGEEIEANTQLQEQVVEAKAAGQDVAEIEEPLNENLSRLASLRTASAQITPPAVPLQDA